MGAFKLAAKLEVFKGKIKEWAKNHFGDMGKIKENILVELLALDKKEEECLSSSDQNRRLFLKEQVKGIHLVGGGSLDPWLCQGRVGQALFPILRMQPAPFAPKLLCLTSVCSEPLGVPSSHGL